MIERTLVLPVTPEELWHELTDPESVAEWFGAHVEWDLTPGGRLSFDDVDDGERVGRINEVIPAKELQFLWWPKDAESETSEVTYRLESDHDGTRLTVTERPIGMIASACNAAFTAWDHRLLQIWLGRQTSVGVGHVRQVGRIAQPWC